MSARIERITHHLGGVRVPHSVRSCIIGSENAAVLPVHVCAHHKTSLPDKIAGIACA